MREVFYGSPSESPRKRARPGECGLNATQKPPPIHTNGALDCPQETVPAGGGHQRPGSTARPPAIRVHRRQPGSVPEIPTTSAPESTAKLYTRNRRG